MKRILCALVLLLGVRSDPCSGLDLIDSMFLSRAIAENRKTVVVALAITPNRSLDVANPITSNGGSIGYVDDEVGYIRARVPLHYVRKIESSPHVNAIQVEGALPYFVSSRSWPAQSESASALKIDFMRYLKQLSHDHSINPFNDMGYNDFTKKYPSYDGRGVTIAIIEHFPDFAMKEIQHAKDLEGRAIPKVAEVHAFYGEEPGRMNHESDRPDGLVRLSKVETSDRQDFIMNGRNIPVPARDHYFVGALQPTNLSALRGSSDWQSEPIVVVWDPDNSCAIIDANRNFDLNDDQCVREFNRFRDIGQLSLSNSNKKIPFVVLRGRSENSLVVATANIHTVGVTMAAAGNSFFGSRLGGAAPEAQIVSISSQVMIDAQVEALIFAARHEKVDVILHMLGHMGANQTKNNVLNIISDRLARLFNKVIIVPAYNQRNQLNSVGVHSAAQNVLSIGQFIGRDVRKILTGVDVSSGPDLYSSAGPTEDGRLAPDILAPSMITVPLPDYLAEIPFLTEICPKIAWPGNASCFNGTSAASPIAAGSVALLIGAAKQSSLHVDSESVISAVKASARLLRGYPVNVQGRGVLDLPSAWSTVKSARASLSKVDLEIRAPIRTTLGEFLSRNVYGQGLYEREGWEPGNVKRRSVTIKRLNGPESPIDIVLKIEGDYSGTFSVQEHIKLPIGKPIDVPLTINPAGAGVYSAFLRITEANSGRYIDDVGLTVVSAPKITAENGYKLRFNGGYKQPGFPRLYFSVPDGMSKIRLRYPSDSNLHAQAVSPIGYQFASETRDNDEKLLDKRLFEERGFSEKVIHLPSGGAWEITLFYDELRGPPGESYFLEVEGVAGKQPVWQEVTEKLTCDCTSGPLISSLGKANALGRTNKCHWMKKSASHGSGMPRLYRMNVPQGLRPTAASVVAGAASGKRNSLLYAILFECTSGRCFARNVSVGRNQAAVSYLNSGEGQWTLAVGGFSDNKHGDVFVSYDFVPCSNK